jgi:hypothetical protein
MSAKGKVLLLMVIAIFLGVWEIRAGSVTLEWDPSPSPGVTGYTLYWTLPDGSAEIGYDVGNTTVALVDNLTGGQTYHFYATAHDDSGNESDPSNTLIYTVPGPISGGGSVTFVRADPGTGGSWKGSYGGEGYSIAGASTALPTYATFATTAPQWTWAAQTTKPSALILPDDSTRIAACWYSSTQVAFDLAYTDGQAHRIAMYFLDASNSGRQQRVDILDAVSGATLYSRQLTNFSSGIYLVWQIGGRVAIRITPTVGNAVVSGVFFDGVPAPGPVTSARFVKSDTLTRGSWKGVYGTQGYSIAGASASLPTYATFATTAPQWTWAAQTTSPSALSLPGGSTSRIAACWYSATEVGFDFGVTDGQTHLVSVYFLDATASGRQQRVDVVDRNTGAVLDTRSLSNFATGVYLSWEIAGNVSIRLTPFNVNAVASGVFFDPRPTN